MGGDETRLVYMQYVQGIAAVSCSSGGPRLGGVKLGIW